MLRDVEAHRGVSLRHGCLLVIGRVAERDIESYG